MIDEYAWLEHNDMLEYDEYALLIPLSCDMLAALDKYECQCHSRWILGCMPL